MDDDVAELLKTWELEDLIPRFKDQQITVQALSALTSEDLKELIPQTGPRVLFTRCWRTWKNEFTTTINEVSFSGLDLSNLVFEQLPSLGDPKSDTETAEQHNIVVLPLSDQSNEKQKENSAPLENQGKFLERLLEQSLESSALLIYKGGTLDGDSTRNLLASVIAKEILNENLNAPIIGGIYFKWTKLITEVFPGERTTTYYIPACTTASGVVRQARGKLVHQVLNKRRRLQQLGSLTTKKRNREESPSSSASAARPLPESLMNTLIENVEDDLLWLENSSEPWDLVETKWNNTIKQRILDLNKEDAPIEAYFNKYPALKKPQGYTLLLNDFKELYEGKDNMFVIFPMAKIKILALLKERKSKDIFCQELINLADSSEEEDRNLAALLSIPFLLNTSTVQQSKKKKQTDTPSGRRWKPSKAETRDAFIKHVRSDAEIGQYIQLRLKTLRDKGVPPQPYVMIVGESLHKIKTYLIIANASVIYQRSNILQAIDTCYKLMWALNVEYGRDSYAIWHFLQRGIYQMTSKFDRGSTTAESLLTDCNL